jgi:hypothetical protein
VAASRVISMPSASWKLDHPAFARVFKLVKVAADDRVERSLYSRAIGYSYLAEKPAMTRHGQKIMRYRAHTRFASSIRPDMIFEEGLS